MSTYCPALLLTALGRFPRWNLLQFLQLGQQSLLVSQVLLLAEGPGLFFISLCLVTSGHQEGPGAWCQAPYTRQHKTVTAQKHRLTKYDEDHWVRMVLKYIAAVHMKPKSKICTALVLPQSTSSLLTCCASQSRYNMRGPRWFSLLVHVVRELLLPIFIERHFYIKCYELPKAYQEAIPLNFI